MSKRLAGGSRFVLWIASALLFLNAATAQLAAQTSSVASSEMFGSAIANSVTDAKGNTYLVSGSNLYVVQASGVANSPKTFAGMTLTAVRVDTNGDIFGAGSYSCSSGQTCVQPTQVVTNGTAPASPAGPAVVKLNSDGTLGYLLVFIPSNPSNTTNATLTGMAIDSSGEAFVTGSSPCGWPTTSTSLAANCIFGDRYGYVTKLSATGQVTYSTYLDGASGGSTPAAIAVDSLGDAFVTGATGAADFPTTVGSFTPAFPGGQPGFVSEINVGGTALVYSTYFPNGQGNAITVDSSGSAYIAGSTLGSLPVTSGVAGSTFTPDQSGTSEAQFAAKLKSNGSGLDYATYLGIAQQTPFQGTGTVYLSTRNSVLVDSSGDLYIGGTTNHAGGPAVAAVQKTLGDGTFFSGVFSGDGYLVELNPGATQYLISTYLGGADGDSITGVGLDSSGAIYLGGMTYINQFPLILQVGSNSAAASGFLTKITAGGSSVPVLFPDSRPPFGTAEGVGSLDFGTSNSGQVITKLFHLGNYGGTALNIGSISSSSGDFQAQNSCPATLNPGEGCEITVNFKPLAAGSRSGTLSVSTDSTAGIQSNRLSGDAVAPGVSLSTTILSFGVVAVGSTSSAQTVTITNTGTQSLTVSSATASPSSFAVSGNTCTSSVAPQATCTISVTFTPSATGEVDGTLTINDNALDTPQTVRLIGGVTPDFALAVATGGSDTQSVTAGSAATYNLTLTPSGGLTGAVNLTCAGAPVAATCTVTPASVTVVGSAPTNIAVGVTTTARTSGFVTGVPLGPWLWLALLCALMSCILAWYSKRAWIRRPAFALGMLALALAAGCGGGSKSSSTKGTPAGTYTLTVTGASATTTHTLKLTLKVN